MHMALFNANEQSSPSFQGNSPVRRGEGGWDGKGGPLWSPAVPSSMETHAPQKTICGGRILRVIRDWPVFYRHRHRREGRSRKMLPLPQKQSSPVSKSYFALSLVTSLTVQLLDLLLQQPLCLMHRLIE